MNDVGELRRARVLACVESGMHPLALALGARTDLVLHADAARTVPATTGPTCGTCQHRSPIGGVAGRYPKCWADGDARMSRGEATDVLASWPACRHWSAR